MQLQILATTLLLAMAVLPSNAMEQSMLPGSQPSMPSGDAPKRPAGSPTHRERVPLGDTKQPGSLIQFVNGGGVAARRAQFQASKRRTTQRIAANPQAIHRLQAFFKNRANNAELESREQQAYNQEYNRSLVEIHAASAARMLRSQGSTAVDTIALPANKWPYENAINQEIKFRSTVLVNEFGHGVNASPQQQAEMGAVVHVADQAGNNFEELQRLARDPQLLANLNRLLGASSSSEMATWKLRGAQAREREVREGESRSKEPRDPSSPVSTAPFTLDETKYDPLAVDQHLHILEDGLVIEEDEDVVTLRRIVTGALASPKSPRRNQTPPPQRPVNSHATVQSTPVVTVLNVSPFAAAKSPQQATVVRGQSPPPIPHKPVGSLFVIDAPRASPVTGHPSAHNPFSVNLSPSSFTGGLPPFDADPFGTGHLPSPRNSLQGSPSRNRRNPSFGLHTSVSSNSDSGPSHAPSRSSSGLPVMLNDAAIDADVRANWGRPLDLDRPLQPFVAAHFTTAEMLVFEASTAFTAGNLNIARARVVMQAAAHLLRDFKLWRGELSKAWSAKYDIKFNSGVNRALKLAGRFTGLGEARVEAEGRQDRDVRLAIGILEHGCYPADWSNRAKAPLYFHEVMSGLTPGKAQAVKEGFTQVLVNRKASKKSGGRPAQVAANPCPVHECSGSGCF